ncbi:adenosylhomocysteinase [candidate division WOR-3 bacterium]|nr:adenosylhomocysteinase [candidate division WOR-3 bacterium]
MDYEIKDKSLSSKGHERIEWASSFMPVLGQIKERFKEEKPLKGISIASCLHVTTETANLMITLKEAGAKVALCASNPLSTQDDVAAALVTKFDIPVFALRGTDNESYYRHIRNTINCGQDITMDDGADLISMLHREYKNSLDTVIGGTEETTTGVIRLRAMARDGILRYPVVAVNDSMTKYLFDNRYGTGQSTIDGILRATNFLIAGSYFVIVGYGWCGKGVAKRASGMGAKVIVVETDPIKALEAAMDGFQVMPLMEAAAIGDIFVTVTGNKWVITKEEITRMKDNAIIGNSGHFNVEVKLEDLEDLSVKKRNIRDNVIQYKLSDGRRINLLGEGRLLNLSCAEGHPAMVMDMSFANQAYSAVYIKENARNLENRVYTLPGEIDRDIARVKLETMGIKIDELTEEQKKYLDSWGEGT